MNFTTLKKVCLLLTVLFLLSPAIRTVRAAETTPNPVLILVGIEPFETGGKQFIRYKYEVFNFDQFPNDLFAASPQLPPCGKNTKAARTWVDIYTQSGQRLNGFCAFGSNKDLRQIWFAMEPGVVPPSWVYIELTDRQTN